MQATVLRYKHQAFFEGLQQMPVETYWHDCERGLIYQVFSGKYTWDKFYPAHEVAKQLLHEAADQRVDIIVDLSQTGHLIPPNTISHVRNLLTGMEADFANWKLTVLISDSAVVANLLRIAQGLSPIVYRRYRLTTSLEDAINVIEAARQQEQEPEQT